MTRDGGLVALPNLSFELLLALVLEGSVRKDGNRVRITVTAFFLKPY